MISFYNLDIESKVDIFFTFKIQKCAQKDAVFDKKTQSKPFVTFVLRDERLNPPLKYLNIWHVCPSVKVRL